MKIKLLLVVFLAIVVFAFNSVSDAEAAGLAPGSCTLDQVGTMPGQNFIFATCPTAGYTNKFFRINHPDAKKELLATALTAISLKSQVRLWIEDDGSTVTRIYINSD